MFYCAVTSKLSKIFWLYLSLSHFIGGAKVRADILLAKNICKKTCFLLDVFDLKIQIKNYLRKPFFINGGQR
jgi:hypothetical protein